MKTLLPLILSLLTAVSATTSSNFRSPEGNWQLEYALIEGERSLFEKELFGLADELCLKSSRWYFRTGSKKDGSIVLAPSPLCSEGQQDFRWKMKKGAKKQSQLLLTIGKGKQQKEYLFDLLPNTVEDHLYLQYCRGKEEKGNALILSLRKE